MTVVVRPAAAADIEDAYRWYTDKGADLGVDFLAAIREAIAHLTEYPEANPVLRRGTRRVRLRRFPYGLLYRVYGDQIVVVACMHGSRDPKTWQSRA